jgi:hypothetical protein
MGIRNVVAGSRKNFLYRLLISVTKMVARLASMDEIAIHSVVLSPLLPSTSFEGTNISLRAVTDG